VDRCRRNKNKASWKRQQRHQHDGASRETINNQASDDRCAKTTDQNGRKLSSCKKWGEVSQRLQKLPEIENKDAEGSPAQRNAAQEECCLPIHDLWRNQRELSNPALNIP